MTVYVLTLNSTVLGVYSSLWEAEQQARRFTGSRTEIRRIQVDRPA